METNKHQGLVRLFCGLASRMTRGSGQFFLLPFFLPTGTLLLEGLPSTTLSPGASFPTKIVMENSVSYNRRLCSLSFERGFTTRHQGDTARIPEITKSATSDRLRKCNRSLSSRFLIYWLFIIRTWVVHVGGIEGNPGFGVRQP